MILKCSRLCLFVIFVLILLYKQIFLIPSLSWLEKERKKQFTPPPPPLAIKFFSFFYSLLLLFQPPCLLDFDIFSSQPYYSTPPSIRDLRAPSTREPFQLTFFILQTSPPTVKTICVRSTVQITDR